HRGRDGRHEAHHRAAAGDLLQRHDHARRVRSERADAQLLPPDRRDRPRALAERARARRRLAPALVRRDQADNRPDPRQLPGDARALAARDRRRAPGRRMGEPEAPAAEAQPLELQRRRGRGGGLPRRALQGRPVEDRAGQAPGRREAEAAALRARPDQGRIAARVVSDAPVEARPLRLCDPDERDDEPQARERPRQPALPRRPRKEVRDPRVARLGELVVNYSLGLQPGKVLRIDAPPVSAPLAIEIYRAALAAGAHPYVDLQLERLPELLLAEANDEQLEYVSPIALAELEFVDAIVTIWSESNTRALTHADPERHQRLISASQQLAKRRWQRMSAGELGWLGVLFPTEAHAQDAQMSLAEYERFVFRACHVEEPGDPVAHWQGVREELRSRAEALAEARELRIVGPGTDLKVGVEGRRWQPADGRYNMPDGEVYTSPLETVTEGEISFAFPALFHGREVTGIQLRFEDGAVVETQATRG